MRTGVLLTEVRRGFAPLALAAVAIVGLAVLFNETEDWTGRWYGLAGHVRLGLIVLVPLALAAGTWQGGRERRRRIDELLASTPRPVWQPTVLRWGGVAAGACGGYVVVWAVCAVFVARVATYSGGGWWWQVLAGVVALGAATAVGFGIGRVVPWRVTAPIAGLAAYVGIGVLSYVDGDDGRLWLSPAIQYAAEGAYLPASFHALQTVWFAALGVSVLVLVGARRRWIALAPVAAAAATGLAIATGPGHDRWQEDPAALEPVCADGTPEVCTTRENSFLLDDFVPVAREALSRWDGVNGGPIRAEALPYDGLRQDHDDTLAVTLRPYTSWQGELSLTGEWGASLVNDLAKGALPPVFACYSGSDDEIWTAVDDVSQVASLWAGAEPRGAGVVDASGVQRSGEEMGPSPAGRAADRLASWSEADQRHWIERYMAAAGSCDLMKLDELLQELS